MSEPRVYTKEEMRDMFMEHLVSILRYWLNEERRPDAEGKLSGLVFSILVLFDGCSGMMPAFEIVPMPHPSDEAYNKDQGENWWLDQNEEMKNVMAINDDTALHEMWHQYYKGE